MELSSTINIKTANKSGMSFMKKLKQYKVLLLMIAPVIVYYFIFSYMPMFGAVLAFKEYDYALGILKSPWTGLKNFEFFFATGQALTVTLNTLLYNTVFIVVNNCLEIIIAIILSELKSKYFKKISQTMIFFPYFISWVVVGTFIYNLFNYDYGVVNSLLKSWGQEPINFYSTPGVWPFIIVAFNAWKGVGYGTVVYLATITGMDTSIYEAAEIDGANIWQRIWHITIPALKPTTITLVLMSVGHIFRGNFDMFYQIIGNNGLLYNTTDVIDTFTFRALMYSNDVGMSSAVGLFQSVLCFVLITIVNAVVKKIDRDSALF